MIKKYILGLLSLAKLRSCASPCVIDRRGLSGEEIALSDNANLSKVDFSRYQTDDLSLAIEEVLSITGNLAYFLRTYFLVWAIGPIIMPLLFLEVTTWTRIAWSFYGAFSFHFVAVGVGIFFTKRRLLGNILILVDIIFGVCGKVLDDIGQTKNRGVRITALALVSNVDNLVVRPVIEGILRSKLGFLSIPLLWMYKGTFGSMIQVIETTLRKIAKEEDHRIAEDNEPRLTSVEAPESLIQRAEDTALRLKDSMRQGHEVSIRAVKEMAKFALLPSFSLSLLMFIIAILPAFLAKI